MATTNVHVDGFQSARQTWLRNTGIFSLFLYAFFWLQNIEISRIGESLMFLSFVIMLFSNKPKFLLREPILYILIAWVIFQTAMYQWAMTTFPKFPRLASDHINEARIISNIFMFFVVAWWLEGSTKRVITMLILCAFGYFIGATFQDGGLLDELDKFQRHARMDFGYANEQHTAVYSAFVLLILITFKKQVISYILPRYRWIARTIAYLAITYAVIAIIASQARATWLSLTVILIIYVIGYFTFKLREKIKKGEPFRINKLETGTILTTTIAIALATIVLSLYNAENVIIKRLYRESVTVEKLIKGNTESIQPKHSIGVRIDSWRMAYDWIRKRPITGWGPQSRKVLISKSKWSKRLKKRYGHLHNSYIELLVDYGFVGLVLYATLFIYIWYRAWQSWRFKKIPTNIMLFIGFWSIYWLIVNIFESYVIYSATGNYINIITAATLYTYHLNTIQNGNAPLQQKNNIFHTSEDYHS